MIKPDTAQKVSEIDSAIVAAVDVAIENNDLSTANVFLEMLRNLRQNVGFNIKAKLWGFEVGSGEKRYHLDDNERSFMAAGDKIGAIKALRARVIAYSGDCGLKDAKLSIDAYFAAGNTNNF